jgi:hypothetical protein
MRKKNKNRIPVCGAESVEPHVGLYVTCSLFLSQEGQRGTTGCNF